VLPEKQLKPPKKNVSRLKRPSASKEKLLRQLIENVSKLKKLNVFARNWLMRLSVTLQKKTSRNSESLRRMQLVSSLNPRLLTENVRKPKPLLRKKDVKPNKHSAS